MEQKMKLLKYKPLDQPRTCIIATIGGEEMLGREDYLPNLIDSGVNIIRVNLSFIKDPEDDGSYDPIRSVIKKIESICNKKKRLVGLLFDICGPKIRIAHLDGSVAIKEGDNITLTTTSNEGLDFSSSAGKVVPVTYGELGADVETGDRILINDGKIELKVVDKEAGMPRRCIVQSAGVDAIESGDGINLPDSEVSEGCLTGADQHTIRKLGELRLFERIDFLGQSFVRTRGDINTLKDLIWQYRGIDPASKRGILPLVIAKIETWQAVRTDDKGAYGVLDGILEDSAGVMVARGDLAGETSTEQVPVIQFYLSQRGNELGRAVIIATQMLSSMTKRGNRRPTRAEASDVANAVRDYVDAVMLSEETAKGDCPELCVKTMQDIIIRAEATQRDEKKCLQMMALTAGDFAPSLCRPEEHGIMTRQQAIAESAILFAENLGSPAVVVSTSSGDTAIMLSRYRPTQPIIAFTDNDWSARRMLLYRDIYPILVNKKPNDFESLVQGYKKILREVMVGRGKVIRPEDSDKVLLPLTLGIQPGRSGSVAAAGNTNTIYILDLREPSNG